MKEEINEKRITGMWLPGEVAFNLNLNSTDKLIWWLINCLDGEDHCFANRSYFVKKLNISEKAISNSFTKLKKLNYIEEVSFNGKIKTWKINLNYLIEYKYLVDIWNGSREEKFPAAGKKSSRQQGRKVPTYNKRVLGNRDNKESSKEDSEAKASLPQNNSNLGTRKTHRERRLKINSDNSLAETSLTRRVFNHWNSKGKPFFQHSSKKSKTFDLILSRTFAKLKKHSFEEIIQAIDLYYEFVSNNIVTAPFAKSLHDFFQTSDIARTRQFITVNSWFDECMKGSKYLTKEYGKVRPDEYPIVSKEFEKAYRKYKRKYGVKVNGSLLPSDINGFRIASEKLVEKFVPGYKRRFSFLNKNRKHIKYPNLLLPYLFEMLEEPKFLKRDIDPYFLTADFIWQEEFPKHLQKRGYLKSK